MYCKFCGKEIDQDSLFCKHCGTSLSSDTTSSKGSLKGISNLKSWFTSLSKGKQICLMVYFLWFWIAFVVCSSEDNFIVAFPILVIIIPAALLMLWYAYTHKWFKRNRNVPTVSNYTQSPAVADTIMSPEKSIIKTYSLTEFAAEHGKMQLQKNYDKKTCSYVVSYIFTNKGGQKTIVEPAEEVTELTAEEIAMQKFTLCVNEYSDGSLKLERRIIQQNPDEDYMPHDY